MRQPAWPAAFCRTRCGADTVDPVGCRSHKLTARSPDRGARMGTELGTGRAGGEATLADSCGRIVKSLRISVTDRCNLRCEYCLPRGLHAFERPDELLSFDDITCVVRVASRLGVNRVRITGGEPLVRAGVPD